MSSPRIVTKKTNKQVLNIDPEMLTLYKEEFDKYDKEKRGTINPDQIRRALKKIGQDVSKADVIEMLQKLDHDGQYNVTFEQFIALMTTNTAEENIDVLVEDEIVKAFRKFDYDKDGKLTGDEFRYVLTKMAKGLSEKEADNILKIANVKNNDYFDFVELVDFWSRFIRRD
jgi:calmodulin